MGFVCAVIHSCGLRCVVEHSSYSHFKDGVVVELLARTVGL